MGHVGGRRAPADGGRRAPAAAPCGACRLAGCPCPSSCCRTCGVLGAGSGRQSGQQHGHGEGGGTVCGEGGRRRRGERRGRGSHGSTACSASTAEPSPTAARPRTWPHGYASCCGAAVARRKEVASDGRRRARPAWAASRFAAGAARRPCPCLLSNQRPLEGRASGRARAWAVEAARARCCGARHAPLRAAHCGWGRSLARSGAPARGRRAGVRAAAAGAAGRSETSRAAAGGRNGTAGLPAAGPVLLAHGDLLVVPAAPAALSGAAWRSTRRPCTDCRRFSPLSRAVCCPPAAAHTSAAPASATPW